MSEVTITKNNFEKEVLNSDKPVIVDFWAPWCGPCVMLAPILEEISKELKGEVTVGKINVDEEAELAIKFNVASIPYVMLFKDGKPLATSVGYKTKDQLKAALGL